MWFEDVAEFHRAINHPVAKRPGVISEDRVKLRVSLMQEELRETITAMHNEDLLNIADGLADLIVVTIGTALEYGIDLRPVWDAVHASNMAKVGGGKRADGKCLKPEGWKPPDIGAAIVRGNMHNIERTK